MTADTNETLTRLAAGQAELRTGQTEIIGTLGAQSQLLRLIAEQLGLLLEKLTPQLGEGPTIEELLAELVKRVGENGAFLRRIDRRTDGMAMSLANNGAGATEGSGGANGNGGDGRDVSGGAGA